MAQELDAEQIIKMIQTTDNNQVAIRIEDAGPPSGQNGTDMDAKQVWKEVYNPTTNKLKVVYVP